MAPNEKESPSIRDSTPRDNRLTIMVMRSVGRVRSFKISSRILFWGTLFFVIYIPISIFFINAYFDLQRANKHQTQQLKEMEEEILASKKNLNRFQQHVALLEDYIRHLEKPEESKEEGAKAEPVREGAIVKKVEKPPGTGDVENTPNRVDIEDVLIQREGSTMTVDFRLVKKSSGETALGGYIHMIAMGSGENFSPQWTFPKVDLYQGLPINFRRGQLFLIQRFKPVHGSFDFPPDSQPPTAIKVLVYDQSGALILEKTFEVSNVS